MATNKRQQQIMRLLGRPISEAHRQRLLRELGYKKPAPAGPKVPASLPLVPQADVAEAGAQRQAGYGYADLAQQEGQIKQEYGFDDPSNPFNRAKMLQQAYESRQRGTLTGMAAQGGLYSGALARAQNLNLSGYQQQEDALRRSYQGALQDVIRRRRDVGETARSTMESAQATRLEAGLNQPAEDPGPPPANPNAALLTRLRQQRRGTKGGARRRLTKTIRGLV
jgi:hypothetical protein